MNIIPAFQTAMQMTGTKQYSVCQGFSFTMTPGGIVALIGSIKTVNVPGLLVGDCTYVSCLSSPSGLGMILANSRVSAPDTLELYFTTAVVLGITLGSLNFIGFALR